MSNRDKPHLWRTKLAMAVKLACTAGLLVPLSVPTESVAIEVVRSSPNAFGIPFNRTFPHDLFAAQPAVTTIDGKGYLQYIKRLNQSSVDTYAIEIIGPFEALLDPSVPWEDLVYSSEAFNQPNYEHSFRDTLVDLDNDGEFELFDAESNRLYTLASSPQLIQHDLVKNLYDTATDPASSAFLDMDGDGDLDLFVSYFKEGNTYFENTGSAEVPRFDRAGEDAGSIWEARKDRLPPGFSGHPVGLADSLTSADIDQDGDLDLIKALNFSEISYFENMGPAQEPRFANPYNPFSLYPERTNWFDITDYDSDGDPDLMVYYFAKQDKLTFFEKMNGRPMQYKPTEIGNMPRIDYFGGFSDLDGDGVQELMAIIRPRTEDQIPEDPSSKWKRLILLKRQGDVFEQIPIYLFPLCPTCPQVRGEENSLQFVDGDNDGDLDIAMRLTGPDDDRYYFEQLTPFSFGPPEILPKEALDLQEAGLHNYPKSADLDGDGDMDAMFDRGFVEWNREREPGSILNFSTRSYVAESSSILIGGFIIEGPSPQTVILRGQGAAWPRTGSLIR